MESFELIQGKLNHIVYLMSCCSVYTVFPVPSGATFLLLSIDYRLASCLSSVNLLTLCEGVIR